MRIKRSNVRVKNETFFPAQNSSKWAPLYEVSILWLLLMVTSSTYQNVMSKRLLFLSVNFVIKIKYLTIEFNKIIDFYFVFIISF